MFFFSDVQGHGTSPFVRTVEDQPESPRATSSRMPLTSSPIHTSSFGSPNMSNILGADISMQQKAPEYCGYRADTQCTFCANRSTFLMAPDGDNADEWFEESESEGSSVGSGVCQHLLQFIKGTFSFEFYFLSSLFFMNSKEVLLKTS